MSKDIYGGGSRRIRVTGCLLVVTILGGIAAGIPQAARAICTDTRDYLRWIGSVEVRPGANDVQVSDGYAYVAAGSGGLDVFDVSDVFRPSLVKELRIPGDAIAIVAQNEFAYIATELGMSIVDLSVPGNPYLMGSVSLPDKAIDLAVGGLRAFLAVGYEGVHIVDVADPSNPEFISRVILDDFAYGVALHENFLFVAEHHSGLRIIDIQDPGNPILVALVALPSAAYNVAVADNLVYVTTQYSGVQIVNVGDPESPRIVGSCAISGSLGGISLAGDIALVATGDSGVAFVDVSESWTAELIGRVDTHGFSRQSFAYLGFVFVADSDGGIQIIDFGNFDQPQMLGTGDGSINFIPYGMTLEGNLAYLVGASGIRILDIGDPVHPVEIGRWYSSSTMWDVVVRDGLAYCTLYIGGLRILDVSDPQAITFVGREAFNYATRMVVSGNHVAVAAESYGISILDVTNPANPKIIKTVDTSGDAVDVALFENYLFVAEESKGVQIFDIERPQESKYLGSIDTPGDASVVVVDNEELFVGDSDAGLLIFSLVSPASPDLLGGVSLPGIPSRISLLGDIAYVSCYGNNLAVDIFDRARPQIIGPTGAGGRDFAVANEFLVCTTSPGLVRTFPLQCPLPALTPRITVDYPPVEIPAEGGIFEFDLEITNSYDVPRMATIRFEAELSDGRVFSILELPERVFPVSPQFIREDLVQAVPGWAPAGQYTYRCLVVDELGVLRSSGFSFSKNGVITPVETAGDTMSGGWNLMGLGTGEDGGYDQVLDNGNHAGSRSSPNPFNGVTTIHFEVPYAGDASLTIYDVAGRAVKQVFSEMHIDQGSFEVTWDGRDDQGRTVAAGVYFYRLETSRLSEIGRVVLVK